MLQQMSAKMDIGFKNQQQSFYPPQMSRQQLFRQQNPGFQRPQQQWGQPQRSQQFSNRAPGSIQTRPRTLTWKGNTGQPVQGNYGFQRRTPTSFPSTGTQPQAVAGAAAAAVDTEQEIPVEDLTQEVPEEQVLLPLSRFMALATTADIEVPDEDLVAAVDAFNFA